MSPSHHCQTYTSPLPVSYILPSWRHFNITVTVLLVYTPFLYKQKPASFFLGCQTLNFLIQFLIIDLNQKRATFLGAFEFRSSDCHMG